MAKAVGLKTRIEVIFLAPALTCARFADAIDVHQHQGLARFRMFAMQDALESQDRMLAPLYTRSLLYFVSGLLEGQVDSDGEWQGVIGMPLVGMARFYQGVSYAQYPEVAKVKAYLGAAPGRVVWSAVNDAGNGLNSQAARHGDFDNDPATLKSIQFMIGQ